MNLIKEKNRMNDMIDSTKENICWITRVKGHEDYLVTNTGAVWSRIENRWLKPIKCNDTGHLKITLDYEQILVHRLVFETFIRPLKTDEICHHIDQNPQNNLYSNLIAMSRSQHAELHRKDTKLSQQTKKKMSNAKIGKKKTQQTKKKMSIANKGKKLSEETKKKISLARKGKKIKPHSQQHKQKLKQAWVRRKERCQNLKS